MFECGMIQDGHTPLETYRLNCKMLQGIRPQELDYIIIGHCHCDHIGLLPALYARGKCNAKIIVPQKSTPIIKEMLLDCAWINTRDAELISSKSEHYIEPLFTEDDVYAVLSHIEEIQSDEIVKISDELSIRYRNAGHILLSKQAEVFISGGSHTRKILFTSDIGNISTQDSRIFVENFFPVTTSNIVIAESTYGRRGKDVTKKTLKEDIDKIKTVVEQYCIDDKNRILFPTFSLDRMPYILWILFSLFGNDENFNVPVLIDSPLVNRLLDCYSNILEGDAKENFDKMMSWKNIKRIINPEDSKAAIKDTGTKIILSSSGMISAGRSVRWAQSILPNTNDIIVFIGYAGEDTIANKIKHSKKQKTITINGVVCKNNCQIIDLHSFSSHAQNRDLINYYKSINCDKIYLVHGDDKARAELKEDLGTAIADCSKTTRVVIVNKSTKINL